MNTYVRAQVDAETKRVAAEILAERGLSVSDAIRLMLAGIAHKHSFDIPKIPNKETIAAIEELRAGRGLRFRDIDSFRQWLNADD